MSNIDKLNSSLDNMVGVTPTSTPLLIISIIGFIAGIKFLQKGGWHIYLGGILLFISGFTLLISVSPAFRSLLV